MAGMYAHVALLFLPLLFVLVHSSRTGFQFGDSTYVRPVTRELQTSSRELTTYGKPIISQDCRKDVQLFKYSRCGGEALNGLQGGIVEDDVVDGCFAVCPSGTSCFRQNRWYWQCLPDNDLPEDPAWAPLTTCECAGGPPPNGSPESPPESSPDPPVGTSPSPPIDCTPDLAPKWADLFNIYSYFFTQGVLFSESVLEKTSLKDLTPFLGDGEKCGNEFPFFQVDLCGEGLACVRKDSTFMQCIKLPALTLLEEGDKCGDTLAYDIVKNGDVAVQCPKGTACLSETAGQGPWTCKTGGGYWQAEIKTPAQCAAFGSGKPTDDSICQGTSNICTPLDVFFGMCIEYGGDFGLGKKSPGEKCGTSSPYDGDFKPFFCEEDSACRPKFQNEAGTDIVEFQCIKNSDKEVLAVDTKCGDAGGPFNGVYTCDATGQETDVGLRLCLQITTDDWRCKNVQGFNFVKDTALCGTDFPYSKPVDVCLETDSSCFLEDDETRSYKCATDCPSDWACANSVVTIADQQAGECITVFQDDPLKVFSTKDPCGPLSESQALGFLLEAITGEKNPVCAENTFCTQKDPLGIYQCLPVQF